MCLMSKRLRTERENDEGKIGKTTEWKGTSRRRVNWPLMKILPPEGMAKGPKVWPINRPVQTKRRDLRKKLQKSSVGSELTEKWEQARDHLCLG